MAHLTLTSNSITNCSHLAIGDAETTYPLEIKTNTAMNGEDLWQLNAKSDEDETIRIFVKDGSGNPWRYLGLRSDGGGHFYPQATVQRLFMRPFFTGVHNKPNDNYKISFDKLIKSSRWNISVDISLKAKDGIWAKGFYVSSDERIKHEIIDTTAEDDLDILRKIEVKRYSYCDNSEHNVLGFIAQQVKSVYPSAVNIKKDFVFCGFMGQGVTLSGHTLTAEFNDDVTMVIGDECLCSVLYSIKDPSAELSEEFSSKATLAIDEEGDVSVFDPDVSMIVSEVVSDVSVNGDISVPIKRVSFILKIIDVERISQATKFESLNVIKKMVTDFHTLKKDRLISLNFSATKLLAEKNERLEAEVSELKNEINNLKQLMKTKLGWPEA